MGKRQAEIKVQNKLKLKWLTEQVQAKYSQTTTLKSQVGQTPKAFQQRVGTLNHLDFRALQNSDLEIRNVQLVKFMQVL